MTKKKKRTTCYSGRTQCLPLDWRVREKANVQSHQQAAANANIEIRVCVFIVGERTRIPTCPPYAQCITAPHFPMQAHTHTRSNALYAILFTNAIIISRPRHNFWHTQKYEKKRKRKSIKIVRDESTIDVWLNKIIADVSYTMLATTCCVIECVFFFSSKIRRS